MEDLLTSQFRERFNDRVAQVFEQRASDLARRTDRMFLYLFGFQWLIAVACAFWLAPTTWAGSASSVHIHVYAAIFLGGVLAIYPMWVIYLSPGTLYSRMVIAASQMLFSMLFIDLTGGRIESHFHIFGSLAFLAFYRDWRPIVLATVITALDHFLRGAFFSTSLYGVVGASAWRAFEHAGWVLFEDVILLISIRDSRAELESNARNQVELESTLATIEKVLSENDTPAPRTAAQIWA